MTILMSLIRRSKISAKLGQVKEPEAIANAARNVKLTAARSNSLAALSRTIRQNLDDMAV
jgi:sulfur transfer protein SufE